MLIAKHQNIIDNAVKANHERTFYSQYPEHPKAYGEEAPVKGETGFKSLLNQPFSRLKQKVVDNWYGKKYPLTPWSPSAFRTPSFPRMNSLRLAREPANAGRSYR